MRRRSEHIQGKMPAPRSYLLIFLKIYIYIRKGRKKATFRGKKHTFQGKKATYQRKERHFLGAVREARIQERRRAGESKIHFLP
jgi:hypothetical protein